MSGDCDETLRFGQSQVSVVVADRRTAEALSLEIQRLAKSLGLDIGHISVECAGDITPTAEQAEESG